MRSEYYRLARSFERRTFSLCLALACISIFLWHQETPIVPFHDENVMTSTSNIRSLAAAYNSSCDISEIKRPDQPIIPTYAASYPGSGSQMTHYLYEALTGIEAGSVWFHRGDTYDHITLKTHYPAKVSQVKGARLMHRVILQIRNPINALPSYHNYIYEQENKLKSHTIHSPANAWIKWRDEHFDEEIINWENHLKYWMDNFNKEGDRLVISYERLIDPRMGPVETDRISTFLSMAEGVDHVVPQSSIPCVWNKVVNYYRVEVDENNKIVEVTKEEERQLSRVNHGKKDDEGSSGTVLRKRRVKYIGPEDPAHPGNSLRRGNVKYEYTKPQLEKVHSILKELKEHYSGENSLDVILSDYIKDVDEKLRGIMQKEQG